MIEMRDKHQAEDCLAGDFPRFVGRHCLDQKQLIVPSMSRTPLPRAAECWSARGDFNSWTRDFWKSGYKVSIPC